jgi:hypothetical protein
MELFLVDTGTGTEMRSLLEMQCGSQAVAHALDLGRKFKLGRLVSVSLTRPGLIFFFDSTSESRSNRVKIDFVDSKYGNSQITVSVYNLERYLSALVKDSELSFNWKMEL